MTDLELCEVACLGLGAMCLFKQSEAKVLVYATSTCYEFMFTVVDDTDVCMKAALWNVFSFLGQCHLLRAMLLGSLSE